eukprot:TRINITY_DN21322_c0_g1_i1.p1 TRINITY_DN21322_c0_g1~~TRINITY_DN21322_c0_g1_i1.p1  ORF type:complete len:601 (+),score=103.25 TRINITY_DN21322_c0_g1_i1:169-1971(+)
MTRKKGGQRQTPSSALLALVLEFALPFWPADAAVLAPERPAPRPGAPGARIRSEESLEPFGRARYDDDAPLVTWQDWSATDNRLGSVCDPDKHGGEQCGGSLVCRQGICRHCMRDKECPSLHQCVETGLADGHGNQCRPLKKLAWEQAANDKYECLCTILVFLASVLSAAAGTGGGGVFVPLLVMLSHIKVEAAVPLSQCMVFCGSVVNLFFFVGQRHPEIPDQPKIDYNCVVLFEPMLVLGVTLGVIVHQTAPKWLIVVLLAATLSLALWRTALKGKKQYLQESAAQAAKAAVAAPALTADAEAGVKEAKKEEKKAESTPGLPPACVAGRADGSEEPVEEPMQGHYWQLSGIGAVWVLMLLSSAHGVPVCSRRYLAYVLLLSSALCAATFYFERSILVDLADAKAAGSPSSSPVVSPGDDLWGRARLPAVAFGAGFLGGLLGLGGGVIVGPVLLEIGMHSEAVQATTAAFVFLSSSLATVQFALLSKHIWHYALWYGGLVGVATLVGQYLCIEVVQKRKRYSAITLSIAGILLASLVALTFVGADAVIQDVVSGRQMWFSSERLCNGDGLGIVTVDVAPSQPWPSDLPQFGSSQSIHSP